MSTEYRDGRSYATSDCWEIRDIPERYFEAWPRILGMLDAYARGDDEQGEYLAVHLYGSPNAVPLPQIFPEFGHLRNKVSNHDVAVWSMLVNGIIYPCYNRDVENLIVGFADMPDGEQAAERLLTLWHRLTDIAVFIKETSPSLDIAGVVVRTFTEYFQTDAIEMMIQLAALYYPPLAALKKAYEKYSRAKKAGRPTDVGQIFRDVHNTAEDIGDITGIGNQLIGDVTASIKESVEQILSDISEWIREMIEPIIDAIDGLIADVTAMVSGIFVSLQQTIEDLIDGAFGFIEEMVDNVTVGIESLIEATAGVIEDTFTDAVEGVTSLIESVEQWFVDIAQALATEIADVFDGIEDFFGEISSQLSALIEPLIAGADSVARSALELVESVPQAFDDAVTRAINFAEGLPERYGDTLRTVMLNPLLNILISDDDTEPAQDEERLSLMLSTAGIERSTAEDIARQIASVAPTAVLPRRLFLGVAIIFLLWQALAAPISVAAERAKQAASLALPHRIMQDADLLVSIVRGLKPEDEAIRELRSTGYSEDDARRMVSMRRQLVPAGEVLAWWLRGLIDDEQLQEQLSLQALAPEDQARLKQAAFFIPPPQDLITMAVREVFSRETAERFGQFEDFPEEFARFARMQGVSEEWARNYWAAHWGLPSPQMGFEMLHRGIIDNDELKLLLKALDVMPYWRDKLIQLSFSPLTRVDIRRMHKLGVIDEGEVRNAYRHIGYSPENAERMTRFTLELNKDRRADSADELVDLSKGQILTAFREGIIDKDRARTLLIALDLSVDAADVLLELAELDQEREQRKQEIALVQEQYKSGLLEFDEAAALIAALGLATIEQSRAIAQLERIEKSRTKSPSKSELDKFWQAKIIGDAEYLKNLRLLGYPDMWAQRYLQLLDKKGA